MKKFTYLLVFIFILTASTYALALKDKTKAVKEEVINLESTNLKYDFGAVEKDKITKKTIKIRNKLDEALEIKSAESGCECIDIDIKPQKVKRGGIFEAEITFDSAGLDQNQYLEEVVYILTGNMEYELIHLVVSVNIANPVSNPSKITNRVDFSVQSGKMLT
jgi:hypothetical protein